MDQRPKKLMIMEAAFEVFSKKGFHGAKVDEIAEKAGVGKGTIYEYFKSKVHLFQEMYKWQMEKFFDSLEHGLDKDANVIEKINTIIKNHTICSKKFKNLGVRLFSESGSHVELDADFKKTIISIYKEKVNNVRDIIEEGIKQGEFRPIDTDLVAMFFFGSLKGISHSIVFSDMDPDPEEITEKFLDLLLNGIKK